jgi:hypothetical protein
MRYFRPNEFKSRGNSKTTFNNKHRLYKIIKNKANVDITTTSSTENINKLKKQKVLVLSLIKDCSKSITHIINVINDLKLYFLQVDFYYVSNNNSDNCSDILQEYSKINDHFHGITYQRQKISIEDRIILLSSYRDLSFSLAIQHYGKGYDYVIVFDSDLIMNIDILPLINSLSIKQSWSCISGNYCYFQSQYYYDQLALRFINEPIDITSTHPNFKTHYGRSINWLKNLYIFKSWQSVDSCFGGISIYHMDELLDIFTQQKTLYSVSKLPPYTCEHTALCLKLSNLKLINPDIYYYNNNKDIQDKKISII